LLLGEEGYWLQWAIKLEGIMKVRMRLGDLLIAAKFVTPEQVAQAMEKQDSHGGRLGDNLVALGAITQEVLDAFLHRIPAEPTDIGAIGIDETELLTLMIKLIYSEHLESIRQFVDAIKLPYHIVNKLAQMAVERRLLRTLGTHGSSVAGMNYALTDEGRNWAKEALDHSRYVGPAPVTIGQFTDFVNLQKITNERITFERIRKAFGELSVEDSVIEKIGPALNSGRAMLFYGPPGNGKTSVALSFASVFDDVIYVPYSVMIEGQIMRVYDPSLHALPGVASEAVEANSIILRDVYDARWVPCRRPFVVTGGELTLEMLDLRYDPAANFYEAPLHVKALGGCFIIDDFGRQLVTPTSLLNRWIVPLESRVDYLKLQSGKSFAIPFEEMVIFSTNIEPEDLMDPAFLRRLPYKLEVGAPSLDMYRQIFDKECQRHGLQSTDDEFDAIVRKITDEKKMALAAYQPKFIIDQIVATCRFMGEEPHFNPRFIDYAIGNLRVHRNAPQEHAGNP